MLITAVAAVFAPTMVRAQISSAEHERDVLPNFDRRGGGPTDLTSAAPAARSALASGANSDEAALLARNKNVHVDRDEITGSPAFVGAEGEFLTGPDGVGGMVPAARLSRAVPGDSHRVVKAFIDEYSGVFGHGSEVLEAARVSRDYVTPHNRLRTVDWEQYLDEIRIFEAGLQAHLTARGELVNLSSHLIASPDQAADRGAPGREARIASPVISAEAAVVIAATGVGADTPEESLQRDAAPTEADARQQFHSPTLLDADVRYVWLPIDGNTLRLCWQVICTTKSDKFMYLLVIDAETGGIHLRHCLTEHISNASYRVFTSDSPSPFSPGLAVPSSFQPPLISRTLVTTPALDTIASPNGWIEDGVMETRGNNVDAHTDLDANNIPDLPRPQATGPERVFDPALDLTQDPSTYREAATVNLFYWCNFMHDKLYGLGFTEAAGNFQNLNFGRGGAGNDAVQADAQDGSGTNNANFSTPPDGMPGRMQMFVFTGSTPHRDGDFDAEVILHEYTHGLSNRLVGGGVGISALQPAGMGEGWSDFYSASLLSEPNDDINGNTAEGAYVSYQLGGLTQNYYYGIRRYPYTTDLSKNPLTFRDIDPTQASPHVGIPRSPIAGSSANEVHNMGELWCVTLWEARAKLINKYGAAAGNHLMLQLTTDGMKLSPANPTFLQARDAIIQADLVDTGGANRIELWTAFAKRGMGASASSPASSTTVGVVEAFDFPDDLLVTPLAPVSITADVGGPFPSQTYALTNKGAASLSWTASPTQPWLVLDVTAGTLAPGASTTITASFTASANTLAVGDYSGMVTFTNTTSTRSFTRTIGLTIQPPSIALFPLDTDPGWTRTGEWAFGHPTGAGGTVHGQPDPTNGATGTNVFGVNLNGDYSTVPGPATYLTAGPFNLTGYANTRVQFQRWLNTDYMPFVTATLEVSRNGITWTRVWDNGSSELTAKTWTKVQHNIAAVADNQPSVFIRWGHQAGGGAFAYSGWNIDDIELLGQTGAVAPTITTQPLSQTASVGATVAFSVAATGLPVPTYQWNFNGSPIVGATASTLTLSNVQVSNAGAYTVTVSNSLGAIASAVATLSGTAPPPTIVTPPSDLLVTAGQSATFSVDATGTEALTYQWRRNGFPIAGATSSAFTLGSASRSDADYYDVLVAAGLTTTTVPPVRLSVAPTTYVTTVAPDPSWNLQLESPNSTGSAVATLSDGRAYVAGGFSSINGLRRTSIARVNTDGVTIDPTFVPPEIDNTVRVIALQSDGKVLIAGDFARVNGLLRSHLARLNFDGSLDPTFAPSTTVNTAVLALAVQGDGRIVIGGSFGGYAGTPRSSLVRLNSDGSLDTSFLTWGLAGTVSALQLQSDGRIVVGGSFANYFDINGVPTSRPRLARLNSNGTLDTTFSPTATPNFGVNSLAVQPDGKVVVGGSFSAVGATPTGNVARFNSDGSLDTAFTATGGIGFSNSVNALVIQADGRILAGGIFTAYAGASTSGIARLNSDGSRDTLFLTLGFSGSVSGLAVQDNGQVLAAGGLSGYLSPSTILTLRSRFARLNADGTLDPGINFSLRMWGTVFTAVPLPSGKMLVSGVFSTARGKSLGSGLVRVNSDGTVDPTFNPGGTGANSNVNSAAVQPDGKIVITGFFTTYNGIAAPGIARLNTDGTLDRSFGGGSGANGGNTLAILPGGRVFVGGSFAAAGNVPRGRVAVFGVSGVLDATFAAGAGANSTVYAAVVQADGKIVIVGNFTTYDGVLANRIARLNADGSLDSTFATGTGCNSDVSTLALQPDGKIVIGGFFSTYNGTARGGVARLNTDGTLDPTFAPPLVGAVLGLVAQEDGRIILRGPFSSVGGAPGTAYLARLNSNGSRDTTFVPGGFVASNVIPSTLLVRDNGQLAMQSSGGASFTVTQNGSGPSILISPSDRSVTVGGTATFFVAVNSVLPYSYQWLFNGAPIPGAVLPALQLTHVQMAQAGSYSVVVTSELGSATSTAATLTVAKAPALVALDNLAQTYDGTPRAVAVTTIPAGLPVVVTYNGSATVPIHAGSYAVAATVADPSYEGSTAGTLTVAKATATVTVGTQTVVYDGTPKSVDAGTSPAGLYLIVAYNGVIASPVNVGTYVVNAVVVDPDYTGAGSGSLTITPATAAIALGSLSATYDGSPKSASAATTPVGLTVALTYDGSATAPSNAGTYSVAASVVDSNYVGTATGTLTIAKATATVTLDGLSVHYDGTPRQATATTDPAGLVTTVTYDGSATSPTYPGSYAVVATIDDKNYTGSASDTLAVSVTALVRHAPSLNGGLDGSVQVLLPEGSTLNSSAWISGDLLVPGAPSLLVNGHPVFAGNQEASGSATPNNYQVILNSGSTLRHLVSRLDPIAFPTVTAPPAPTGTRNVVITTAGQSVGPFSTLRDLTLNGNADPAAIPAGTYGVLTARGSSGLVLGSAGVTTPTVYNLQGLTLGDSSQLILLGPVVINTARGPSIQVSVGSAMHPEWLTLNVASGDVMFNGSVTFNGNIVAPSGTVMINGGATVNGGVISDRLSINGNGLLVQPTQ